MNRPKTISNADADRLIQRLPAADRALIGLAIESGLRIGDILNLRAGDIRRQMYVWESKSKRAREFKISEKLYNRLRDLCIFKRSSDYVFHSARKSGRSVHRSTIHRRIKKALKSLNFDCSAHSTRKLYAQNVFRRTKSIDAVQDALHHQKRKVTLTYLDLQEDDKK